MPGPVSRVPPHVRYDPGMRWLSVVTLVLSGCSSCGASGPAVPFGLDDGPRASLETDDEPSGRDGRADEGRAFPAGTTRVEIEGAAIEDPGSIRALWAHDVDGDGDRDAIAIVDAPVRVLFVRRAGASFEAPRVLGRAPTPAGCALTSAAFQTIGASWLIAVAELGCEGSPADASVERFVLDADRTPRLLDQLAILAPGDRAAGEISLRFDAEDRDEDGRDDLVVDVGVAREGRSTSLAISWLDRPSGLARDPDEPEHTFDARSRDALRRLGNAPAEALARSSDVIALHEVLCQERGIARLRIGNRDGVRCGQSSGAGRAATTIVRAHAARGETMEALEAFGMLEQPGLLINEERWSFARQALARLPATPNMRLREGPTVAIGGGGVRLSALGFIDEGHVLLRGNTPQIWDLASDATTPTDLAQGDRRVRDPSGRFVIAAIERTCDGYVLRVTADGLPLASPLLVEAAPPRGATCPLEGARARDDGGWHILGWAPQGVLAAHGSELRVVPLDVSARPAGPATTLDPGTPPPAPLPAGTIDVEGRFHVELRGPAVLVHPIRADAEPELRWPQGWAERQGEVTDAAVSPSGRRVAVLRGNRVYLFEEQRD